MKANDIKVGATYRNAGAGRTQRRVIGIGPEFQPDAWHAERPDGWLGVEYQQRGAEYRGKWRGDWMPPQRMWLDSFASWACSEVAE